MLPQTAKDSHSFHNFAHEPADSDHHQGKNSKPTGDKSRDMKAKSYHRIINAYSSESKSDTQRKPKSIGQKASVMEDTEARNDRSSADVPNPVPDTGIHLSSAQLLSVVTIHSVLPPVNSPTDAHPMATITIPPVVAQASATKSISFVPLPPLLTAFGSAVSTKPPTSRLSPTRSNAASSVIETGHPQKQFNRHISTAVITLLAVGSAFALLGIFIAIRICTRPRKRTHPTPSLPILQDDFPDKYTEEGSPLFGGKERFSAVKAENFSGPGNLQAGLWTWTQYSQPNLENLEKITRADSATKRVDATQTHDSLPKQKVLEQDQQYEARSNGATTGTINKNIKPPAIAQLPLQPGKGSMNRVASRLSTMSMSLYPTSPLNMDVGLAIDGTTLPNGDEGRRNLGFPTRSKSSTLGDRNRDTTLSRYSQGFAYGGVDVASPTLSHSETQPIMPTIAVARRAANGGRARIKSTYFAPGAYPRVSGNMRSDSTSAKRAFEDTPAFQRSESRRNRDTRALTSALGLETPDISNSPQPTLYPDDSMSVVGDPKRNGGSTKRSSIYKKPVPSQPTQPTPMGPSAESSASLGSLMLADYGVTSKLTTKQGQETEGISSSPSGLGYAKLNIKRADDKPPRVPSPPPLPSLAQMALQHTNPDAYADYSSPTYSIYGLYEADRKSRVTSFGY